MGDETLVPRQLFGGAILLSFPSRFDDVSEHRQVPDNQEVFSDPSLDQSIIVEVVEHDAAVPDADCGDFFFYDLAEVSRAESAALSWATPLPAGDVPGVPPDAYRCIATGEQAVSKGRQDALNKVQVAMLIVRLPQHGSDVLVTLNTPIFISEGSSAAEHAGPGYKTESLTAPALLANIAATLRIIDYGLFGGKSSARLDGGSPDDMV